MSCNPLIESHFSSFGFVGGAENLPLAGLKPLPSRSRVARVLRSFGLRLWPLGTSPPISEPLADNILERLYRALAIQRREPCARGGSGDPSRRNAGQLGYLVKLTLYHCDSAGFLGRFLVDHLEFGGVFADNPRRLEQGSMEIGEKRQSGVSVLLPVGSIDNDTMASTFRSRCWPASMWGWRRWSISPASISFRAPAWRCW